MQARRSIQLVLPAVILLVAAVLRFWDYQGFSYSNDELSALLRLKAEGIRKLIDAGVYPDFHPAGVQVFMYLWAGIGGISEAWMRLPFVLAGTAATAMTWALGRKWYSEATGWIAAAMMAVLAYPVLFSRLARPYAFGMLFMTLVAWFWTRILFDWEKMGKADRAGSVAGLSLSFALCMYDHYFCFLSAAILGLTGLFLVRRATAVPYLVAAALAVLLFLPHLPVSLHHFSIGGLSTWLGMPDLPWPWEHWVYIFNGSIWMAVLTMLLLIMAVVRRKLPNHMMHPRLLVFWWLMPLLIGWVYSRAVNPVLQHSILIFSFPFLLIALASPAGRLKTRTAQWIAVLLLLGGSLHTVVVRGFYSTWHFADFKDAAAFVHGIPSISSGDAALALAANNTWYFEHYYGPPPSSGYLVTDVRDMDSLRQFRQRLDTLRKDELVFVSLRPGPRETLDLLLDHYPCMRGFRQHGDVSWVAWLSRSHVDCNRLSRPEALYRASEGFEANGDRADTLWFTEGRQAFFLPAEGDFSPTIEIPGYDLPSAPCLLMHASCAVFWRHGEGDPQLVGSVVDSHGADVLWRATPARVFLDQGKEGIVHLWMDLRGTDQADLLKVYLWEPGQASVSIDQLSVEIFRCEND